MGNLNDIVEVNITKETSAVSQAGFGVALILGPNASGNFDAGEYIRRYTDPSEMLDDGFTAEDIEYKIASTLMSQSPKPSEFKIGVHDAGTQDTLDIDYVGTLTSGSVSVVVNGTTYTEAFDTDETTTMDALAAAIALDALIDTASYLTGKLTIVSLAGQGIDYGGTPDIGDFTSASASYDTQSSSIVTDINNIDDQDPDWYALLLSSTTYDDTIAAAALIETQERLFGFDEISSEVLKSGEELTATYKINSLNYEHSSSIYNQDRDEYKFSGWFGRALPADPGSINWAYKTISGISSYKLTAAQQTELENKRCNFYTERGGLDITRYGYVARPSLYLDIIRGEHWLTARIQERVYGLLVNNDKVPYTDDGITAVQNEVFGALREGVDQGYLVDDENLTVTAPKVADIPDADQANRHVPDVEFTANLAGAINTVQVNGTLSLE